MLRRALLVISNALVFSVTVSALPTLAQTPTIWRLANEYPATSLPGEADTFFAQAVRERTEGRVAVEPMFDAKSGLRTKDQVQAVAKNTVTMASSFGGALDAEDGFFLLSSLPFLTASAADAQRLFNLARPIYDRLFAARNQRLLYISPWPASGVWSAFALDDAALARLKIRTYDKTGTDVFNALGGQARVVSFADLPPLLTNGDINSVLSSGDGGAGRRLWDQLKYFSEIQYATPLSFATVNLDAWGALDAATQAHVSAAATATSARQWQAMAGRVDVNYARMQSNGMTIDRAPSASRLKRLRDVGAQAERDWIARVGDEGQRILRAYRP